MIDCYKSNFDYDIMNWIKNKYKTLEKVDHTIDYNFFVSKIQKNAIMTQLKENKSKNINSKFRDMSVYTSTNQFFYSIEKI